MNDDPTAHTRRSISSITAALSTARFTSIAKRLFRDNARRMYHPLADAVATCPSPLVLDRGQLQATCRREGSLMYYGTSEVFDLTVPVSHGLPTDSIEHRDGEHLVPTPFVGVLPDVRLLGRHPLPMYDRRIVLEAVGRPDVVLLNVYYTVAEGGCLGTTSGTRTLDRGVLLHNCWARGYFHWITEMLTRLEGVEHYRERTGEQPTLVLGPDPPKFQTDSLRLLGYDAEDWIEWDGTTTVVNRFVVPSMRRGTNRGSKVGLVAHRWLSERLREAAVDRVDTDRFSPRVYVSRADADRRRVINETDVLEVLSAYGFESYRLADMSVAENVALFSQAEVVVAPHGAGLTNLLFTADASVVELFRPNNTPTYFVLAQHAGHQHRYLECEPIGVDLAVDIDELDAVVSETLPGE